MRVVERDWIEPVQAARCWADDPGLVWLDSADAPEAGAGAGAGAGERSRYSYIAIDPFHRLIARGETVWTDGVATQGDPFRILQTSLRQWRDDAPPGPAPFTGGAIGYLGYEMARHLEDLPRRHPASGLPDMAVGFFDLVIAFDHREMRCWICASGLPETTPSGRHARAEARLAWAAARLRRSPAPRPWVGLDRSWRPDLDRAAYEMAVARLRQAIGAGDIFQANLTTAFRLPRPANLDPFGLYEALRARSPAPFAAYLRWGGAEALISASPERFLRLDADGTVETRPIKGTAPRGRTAAEDQTLAEALASSIKDRAENLMIVDLMRNDLGRVAAVGSIAVPALCQPERFAAVHHLVSEVRARLRPGLDAVDLLRATFPGGSITGAPKIRAMELIDATEASARGPYCGSVVWMGFDGAMDSSIIIRSLVLSETEILAQAGGGIVWDSDPAAEYAEMRLKIAPLLAAVTERGPPCSG